MRGTLDNGVSKKKLIEEVLNMSTQVKENRKSPKQLEAIYNVYIEKGNTGFPNPEAPDFGTFLTENENAIKEELAKLESGEKEMKVFG